MVANNIPYILRQFVNSLPSTMIFWSLPCPYPNKMKIRSKRCAPKDVDKPRGSTCDCDSASWLRVTLLDVSLKRDEVVSFLYIWNEGSFRAIPGEHEMQQVTSHIRAYRNRKRKTNSIFLGMAHCWFLHFKNWLFFREKNLTSPKLNIGTQKWWFGTCISLQLQIWRHFGYRHVKFSGR